jgi:hypothetical protein
MRPRELRGARRAAHAVDERVVSNAAVGVATLAKHGLLAASNTTEEVDFGEVEGCFVFFFCCCCLHCGHFLGARLFGGLFGGLLVPSSNGDEGGGDLLLDLFLGGSGGAGDDSSSRNFFLFLLPVDRGSIGGPPVAFWLPTNAFMASKDAVGARKRGRRPPGSRRRPPRRGGRWRRRRSTRGESRLPPPSPPLLLRSWRQSGRRWPRLPVTRRQSQK